MAPDPSRSVTTRRKARRPGLFVTASSSTARSTDRSRRSSGRPDSRRIAFVSWLPGPETEDLAGDPVVITRYLYKPDADEGESHFNDNRRLHIFVADVATRQVRQLTTGNYYEHSIDWSPRGDEILFVSNREPDPDRFFNYDIFAIAAATGKERVTVTGPTAPLRSLAFGPDGKTLRSSCGTPVRMSHLEDFLGRPLMRVRSLVRTVWK